MRIGLHDVKRDYLRHKNSAATFQTAQRINSFDALSTFRLMQALQREEVQA